MEERRSATRHPFQQAIEVIHAPSNQSFNLLRGNIGFGGTGGFTPNILDAGEEVMIRLHFPQRSGEVVQEEVSGKIIWSKQDGNFTAMGLAYTSLTRTSQPLLFSYLQLADQYD